MGVVSPPGGAFDSVLNRMYQREGLDTLQAHLEDAYGFKVAKMSALEVGVFRIDRSDKGRPLVARVLPAARPYSAAEADLAALRYLAAIGFPAERPFGQDALTRHRGQAVLVTEFVKAAAKIDRPSFPVVRLGAMVGRLHGLEDERIGATG
ncbi:MAG TPA: hypothetical protein VFA11_18540 [Acidimicrobiales bacterium]|nr:hypothetical protein [Acidimicrobiales bacterium]